MGVEKQNKNKQTAPDSVTITPIVASSSFSLSRSSYPLQLLSISLSAWVLRRKDPFSFFFFFFYIPKVFDFYRYMIILLLPTAANFDLFKVFFLYVFNLMIWLLCYLCYGLFTQMIVCISPSSKLRYFFFRLNVLCLCSVSFSLYFRINYSWSLEDYVLFWWSVCRFSEKDKTFILDPVVIVFGSWLLSSSYADA